MSTVVDRLTRMTLNLSSPDGNLLATVDSERRASFAFDDEDDFDDYRATELSEQVAALIRAMDTGRRTGIARAYAAEGREAPEASDSQHWDAAQRRFREALAASQPVGASPGGLVTLAANASLSDCRVRIDGELLERVEAATFLSELTAAYRALLADRTRQRAELIERHLRT